MSRYGWVPRVSFLIVVLFVVAGATASEELSFDLDASGVLGAQLHGFAFCATIEGEGLVSGTVPCGVDQVYLASNSTVTGVGFYNLLDLGAKAWLLSETSGSTHDQVGFTVRSLAYIVRQTLTPLKEGDIFEGVHHTVIQIGDALDIYWGCFSGTLSGGLSAAGPEGILQLTGRGCFHLSGEKIAGASATDFPATIPLDDPDLPVDFLRAVEASFF